MNWLGYLALLFSALCLLLHRPWSLWFAIAAALCGLISTAMRHRDVVKQANDSFVAKVLVAAVAAAAIFFSPWIVNRVLTQVTLLRPSAFPAAYSAYQFISVLVLWVILAYVALIAAAVLSVIQIASDTVSTVKRKRYVKTEIPASCGRLAGLIVILFYLAPMSLRAANFDSGGLLSDIVVTTSFVENRGASIFISSFDSQLLEDCKKLAQDAKFDMTRGYLCSATTIRCSNIDPDAKIAFLDDKGAIAIAKEVDASNILRELIPVRFDLDVCKTDKRYDIQVYQK
jgi:hypothetical protein